jgi:hypothetical protein
MWTIEPVQNVDGAYVRIRNRWKPDQYLNVEHGHIESGPIDPGWFSAMWSVLRVDGEVQGGSAASLGGHHHYWHHGWHPGRHHHEWHHHFWHQGGHHHGAYYQSDIRLKEDIVPLTRLGNGIELYRFRYKGSDHTAYVGVMAQEVQKIEPSSVSRDRDGYLMVDYDRLGLKFMTWDEWQTSANYQSAH